MFVEHKVFIGLRDVALDNKVTNTALLSYLEDAGGVHSNIVGYGLRDIPEKKVSWILLNWKIKIYKRPKYGENIIVKTWGRDINKLYAFRDFEILDENRNVLGIATSNWVLVNVEKARVVKIDEEIGNAYTVEGKKVFEDEIEKLHEPENYDNSTTFTVNRSLIDVNQHLHNIYFMDIANEVLPMDVYKNKELNNIKMMYKHEIKLGDTVKVLCSSKNDVYTIVIKNEDESKLHAIIELSE